MIIKRYGIVMETITDQTKDLLRTWRNSEHVRNTMIYQKIISEEEHEKWFNSLNVDKNFYFVFSSGNNKIGVINLKDINHKEKTAEAGIFIGNTEFMNTPEPLYAVLALMDFAFLYLKMNVLFATVKSENENALRFNEALGYTLISKNDNGIKKFFVTKNRYFSVAHNLRKMAIRIFGESTEVVKNANLHEYFYWS